MGHSRHDKKLRKYVRKYTADNMGDFFKFVNDLSFGERFVLYLKIITGRLKKREVPHVNNKGS